MLFADFTREVSCLAELIVPTHETKSSEEKPLKPDQRVIAKEEFYCLLAMQVKNILPLFKHF
jgi:hypothetical protein